MIDIIILPNSHDQFLSFLSKGVLTARASRSRVSLVSIVLLKVVQFDKFTSFQSIIGGIFSSSA